MNRDWRSELDAWLAPFVVALRNKTRGRMCPAYIAGLIGPGDRKSVQPMAARDGDVSYDKLHHFIGSRSGQSATSGSGVAPARVTAARRFAPPFEGHHARLENGVAFAGSFDEFPVAASESRSVRSTGPLLAFPRPEYFRTCR